MLQYITIEFIIILMGATNMNRKLVILTVLATGINTWGASQSRIAIRGGHNQTSHRTIQHIPNVSCPVEQVSSSSNELECFEFKQQLLTVTEKEWGDKVTTTLIMLLYKNKITLAKTFMLSQLNKGTLQNTPSRIKLIEEQLVNIDMLLQQLYGE